MPAMPVVPVVEMAGLQLAWADNERVRAGKQVRSQWEVRGGGQAPVYKEILA